MGSHRFLLRRPVFAAVGCAAAVVLTLGTLGVPGTGLAATRQSSPRAARPLSWALLSRMTPLQVAALQNPLIAVADPIQRAGGGMPGLYTSIVLDTPDHALDLYVTDYNQGSILALIDLPPATKVPFHS